jgi:hypothetical protein
MTTTIVISHIQSRLRPTLAEAWTPAVFGEGWRRNK